MQVTTIFAFVLAATGALAIPGRQSRPTRPDRPNNIIQQTINCGGSAGGYCCSPEYDSKLGLNYYDCYGFDNSCNAMLVCCQNNVQDGSVGNQACSAFGDAKVIFH
ncbi:hypothetical protein NW759_011192 [Fusarium solani]|nr:hypothetical protein NW759_011192 [Fusarium solani]